MLIEISPVWYQIQLWIGEIGGTQAFQERPSQHINPEQKYGSAQEFEKVGQL